MPRADAHLHFFQPGYVDTLPEGCRRTAPDEVTLYAALAERHGIAQALAVGYEGLPWAAGNNAYLAGLAAQQRWIRPVAFCDRPERLRVGICRDATSCISTDAHPPPLAALARAGFVGISLYRFSLEEIAALNAVDDAVWRWLAERRWLISVNGRGATWDAWGCILDRHPDLRLLIAHLGLPPRQRTPPAPDAAARLLAPVLELARFPNVYVKLSGLYALSEPGHDYPHRAAWPYVAALLNRYGPQRMLWGSDFSPSLEYVSFPQTLGVLDQLPGLSEADRGRIAGGNLLELLGAVVV